MVADAEVLAHARRSPEPNQRGKVDVRQRPLPGKLRG